MELIVFFFTVGSMKQNGRVLLRIDESHRSLYELMWTGVASTFSAVVPSLHSAPAKVSILHIMPWENV